MPPYTPFGNSGSGFIGKNFLPGEYQLTATPFSERWGQGAAGISSTIHFRVIAGDNQVTGFRLIKAGPDTDVGSLSDGDVLDIAELGTDFLDILTLTEPATVGSIHLELSGPKSITRIENYVPYALFGDSGSDFLGANLPIGHYTLTATPYSRRWALGLVGTPLRIQFEVINAAPSIPNNDIHATIYPNPTESGIVHLDTGREVDKQIQVEVYDEHGNLLLKKTTEAAHQGLLDISKFEKGTYLVNIIRETGIEQIRVIRR